MGSEKGKRQRRCDIDDETAETDTSSRRPRINPGDRDEYDEWRRERGSRGRKPKTRGWHRYREEDDYLPGS